VFQLVCSSLVALQHQWLHLRHPPLLLVLLLVLLLLQRLQLQVLRGGVE
jgi:hypothetical protein